MRRNSRPEAGGTLAGFALLAVAVGVVAWGMSELPAQEVVVRDSAPKLVTAALAVPPPRLADKEPTPAAKALAAQAAATKASFTAKFGWRPDKPGDDPRAKVVFATAEKALPAAADLSARMPPVYDQGRIGSCTAQAWAAEVQFDLLKAGKPAGLPSRLFIYWNERVIEKTTGWDSGAELRDGAACLAKLGVCPEWAWPYDDTPTASDEAPWPRNARAGQKPPAAVFKDALKCRLLSYQRLDQSRDQLKGCVAAGVPFVFGFTVYESFFDDRGAPKVDLPTPKRGESVEGGHAVVCVGYDFARPMPNGKKGAYKIRNSWGAAVHDRGHFWMPDAYVEDARYASDFWVGYTVSGSLPLRKPAARLSGGPQGLKSVYPDDPPVLLPEPPADAVTRHFPAK